MRGTVVLSAADRKDMVDGQLMVRVFLRDAAGSAGDLPIAFAK